MKEFEIKRRKGEEERILLFYRGGTTLGIRCANPEASFLLLRRRDAFSRPKGRELRDEGCPRPKDEDPPRLKDEGPHSSKDEGCPRLNDEDHPRLKRRGATLVKKTRITLLK
jgi:hypothetical protein